MPVQASRFVYRPAKREGAVCFPRPRTVPKFWSIVTSEKAQNRGAPVTASTSVEQPEPPMKSIKLCDGSDCKTLSSSSVQCPMEESDSSDFPTLPWELFLEIASYFSKKDLCTLRLLNKQWCEVVDRDVVWQDLLIRTYGLRQWQPSGELSCKTQFIQADRLSWSPELRSVKIEMSNDNKTVKDICKGDEKFRWVTALSQNVYAAGVHYAEVVVDQCCESSKNTIKFGFGVVDECKTLTHNCPFGYSHGTYTTQDLNSWVYLGDGRIMARNQNTGLCGKPWSKGDRVGVLLNFFTQKLSFYLNGERQIDPLPMVCGQVHLAMSLIGGNQATLVRNPSFPVNA